MNHIAETGTRITSNPKVMMGKPCVAGTRVTVETILNRFAERYTLAELLDDYPNLTREDVEAALAYATQKDTYGRAHSD